jgi:hypothetical protein
MTLFFISKYEAIVFSRAFDLGYRRLRDKYLAHVIGWEYLFEKPIHISITRGLAKWRENLNVIKTKQANFGFD